MADHSDLRNTLSLDSLNFFLADVRDGLGPYLAIYLLAVHKWDPASIGVVMTLAGIAALLTQGPAGALIDRTRSKRGNRRCRAVGDRQLRAIALRQFVQPGGVDSGCQRGRGLGICTSDLGDFLGNHRPPRLHPPYRAQRNL